MVMSLPLHPAMHQPASPASRRDAAASDAGSAAWKREMERAMAQSWFDHPPPALCDAPARAEPDVRRDPPVAACAGPGHPMPRPGLQSGGGAAHAAAPEAALPILVPEASRPAAGLTGTDGRGNAGQTDAGKFIGADAQAALVRLAGEVAQAIGTTVFLTRSASPVADLSMQAAGVPEQGLPDLPEPPASAAQAAQAAAGRAGRTQDAEPMPPVRLHAEWAAHGVRLWLGSDARAGLDTARLAQQMQRWLAGQGLCLLSLVCNGKTLYAAAPSVPLAQRAGVRFPELRDAATSFPELPFNEDMR